MGFSSFSGGSSGGGSTIPFGQSPNPNASSKRKEEFQDQRNAPPSSNVSTDSILDQVIAELGGEIPGVNPIDDLDQEDLARRKQRRQMQMLELMQAQTIEPNSIPKAGEPAPASASGANDSFIGGLAGAVRGIFQ
jgi:hypothetical protein